MKVTIFHNVQQECLQCREPVMTFPDGRHAHRGDGAGHEPAQVSPAGFSGYRPGHSMSRVFETAAPDGEDPYLVAGRMFEEFNVGTSELARAYRARGLRSLSVGDVVAAGEIPLAVARAGFIPVTGTFRDVPSREPGSVSLPQCCYCRVTGDETTLEPFNLRGNLACRDVAACAGRQGSAP